MPLHSVEMWTVRRCPKQPTLHRLHASAHAASKRHCLRTQPNVLKGTVCAQIIGDAGAQRTTARMRLKKWRGDVFCLQKLALLPPSRLLGVSSVAAPLWPRLWVWPSEQRHRHRHRTDFLQRYHEFSRIRYRLVSAPSPCDPTTPLWRQMLQAKYASWQHKLMC